MTREEQDCCKSRRTYKRYDDIGKQTARRRSATPDMTQESVQSPSNARDASTKAPPAGRMPNGRRMRKDTANKTNKTKMKRTKWHGDMGKPHRNARHV